jgi:GNAT superfamily N-acetyltransferase
LSAAQPSNITIRPATPADAAVIRDLTRAAYAKWIPVIGREPKPMAADHDRAVRTHPIDLLIVDGRLAALVEMIDEGEHWLIENLAVHPDFQGRGFGKRMLAHAEYRAAEANMVEMRLYTNKLFAENIRFYLAHGYKIDREEPCKDGFITHMSKVIGL